MTPTMPESRSAPRGAGREDEGRRSSLMRAAPGAQPPLGAGEERSLPPPSLAAAPGPRRRRLPWRPLLRARLRLRPVPPPRRPAQPHPGSRTRADLLWSGRPRGASWSSSAGAMALRPAGKGQGSPWGARVPVPPGGKGRRRREPTTPRAAPPWAGPRSAASFLRQLPAASVAGGGRSSPPQEEGCRGSPGAGAAAAPRRVASARPARGCLRWEEKSTTAFLDLLGEGEAKDEGVARGPRSGEGDGCSRRPPLRPLLLRACWPSFASWGAHAPCSARADRSRTPPRPRPL